MLTTINTHVAFFVLTDCHWCCLSTCHFSAQNGGLIVNMAGVRAYLDNVIVAEKKEENEKTLRAVLGCVRQNGVKLRQEKLYFWNPKVY